MDENGVSWMEEARRDREILECWHNRGTDTWLQARGSVSID